MVARGQPGQGQWEKKNKGLDSVFDNSFKWAATWQNQQYECAPSKDSDQPGHPPSLIRVFAVRMKKSWVLSYPLSAHRRLWSDWADAQADLSLRWAHMPFMLWRVHCWAIVAVIKTQTGSQNTGYFFAGDVMCRCQGYRKPIFCRFRPIFSL